MGVKTDCSIFQAWNIGWQRTGTDGSIVLVRGYTPRAPLPNAVLWKEEVAGIQSIGPQKKYWYYSTRPARALFL